MIEIAEIAVNKLRDEDGLVLDRPESPAYYALRNNLRKHGMRTPVFVFGYRIISGHYRFMAWRDIGNRVVPVVQLDSIEPEKIVELEIFQ